jgi:AcrR family transcriptional regulator
VVVAVASAKRAERYRVEREQILRAAFRLLRRHASAGAAVHEILREARLSTRAFYRHFRSKNDLVLTMYRSASERAREELSAAVAGASGPSDALEAWIRQYLAVVFDSRRARQASVLSSPAVRAVPGWDQVRQEQVSVHRTMLAEVIRSGRRLGVFPDATNPEEDARAVLSVVEGLVDARLAGAPAPDWATATAHTAGLFRRAFGAPRE